MNSFDAFSDAVDKRARVERYLEKRQFYPLGINREPAPDLGMVAVIPCFDEPDIAGVLASLTAGEQPDCDVEVIVVINAPAGAPASVIARNGAAAQVIADRGAHSAGRGPDFGSGDRLTVHAVVRDELPPKQAGVGLARKIGMDEAASRLARSSSTDGLVVSLDADCVVAPGYLASIQRSFAAQPDVAGASVYFEHPDILDSDRPLARALVDYELHMRCYVAGQRLAQFPYAFHTLGSAMVCRASDYVAEGGMNLRQGGEDFYFAQKLIGSRSYMDITDTTVYPGARLSHRVPFGTGPAVDRALRQQAGILTFAPQIYFELQEFCRRLEDSSPDAFIDEAANWPDSLADFLAAQDFVSRLSEIRDNTGSADAFRKRVFRWMNAFRFLKFAQSASRSHHPKVPVLKAATALAQPPAPSADAGASDWLRFYRRLDRQT